MQRQTILEQKLISDLVSQVIHFSLVIIIDVFLQILHSFLEDVPYFLVILQGALSDSFDKVPQPVPDGCQHLGHQFIIAEHVHEEHALLVLEVIVKSHMLSKSKVLRLLNVQVHKLHK